MQKIVAITWARNEADILETFVRYHCKAVDRMVVVLHRCEDESHNILLKLQKEGLPIDIREDDSPIHRQSAALTDLMHITIGAGDCDWILPLDADEFLVGVNIHKTVEQLPKDRITLLPWKTYVPTPSDDAQEMNILKRIVHRRSAEEPQFQKVLIPRFVACKPGSHLPEGNHEVLLKKRDCSIAPIPSEVTDALWLAHFPVRSEHQIRQKICNGWESHTLNPERKEGQAFQWKTLYERCNSRAPITAVELQTMALHYAMPEGMVPTCPLETVKDPVASPPIKLLYTGRSCENSHKSRGTPVE
jgi:hypothetical protein